jgi:hypothetical protein
MNEWTGCRYGVFAISGGCGSQPPGEWIEPRIPDNVPNLLPIEKVARRVSSHELPFHLCGLSLPPRISICGRSMLNRNEDLEGLLLVGDGNPTEHVTTHLPSWDSQDYLSCAPLSLRVSLSRPLCRERSGEGGLSPLSRKTQCRGEPSRGQGFFASGPHYSVRRKNNY